MELKEEIIVAGKLMTGTSNMDLTAGDDMDIRKKIGADPVEKILDETVPAGKKWSVIIRVDIKETAI